MRSAVLVNFDRRFATELLAEAERPTEAALGGDMLAESQLRDETLQLLGLADSAALLEQATAGDSTEILTRLKSWLADQQPSDQAPPTQLAPLLEGRTLLGES